MYEPKIHISSKGSIKSLNYSTTQMPRKNSKQRDICNPKQVKDVDGKLTSFGTTSHSPSLAIIRNSNSSFISFS